MKVCDIDRREYELLKSRKITDETLTTFLWEDFVMGYNGGSGRKEAEKIHYYEKGKLHDVDIREASFEQLARSLLVHESETVLAKIAEKSDELEQLIKAVEKLRTSSDLAKLLAEKASDPVIITN